MSISPCRACESSGSEIRAADVEITDYCREIEAYLCRKNDGHLIRVVGPSFEMVSRWATDGVPLKVAFGGIDRYVERYYRKGPRRRPVRIDFCEADVLDVFDEWRRATGVAASAVAEPASEPSPGRRGPSLPEHLERVLRRLTNARATSVLDSRVDDLIDRLSAELDRARGASSGLRGEARQALIDRLAQADRDLMGLARPTLDERAVAELTREAESELAPFRSQMATDVYERARDLAVDRLVRDRLGLPVLVFS